MIKAATADSDRHASTPSDAGYPRPFAGERVYLAARTARQEEMKAIASELKRAGAAIVSRWIDCETSIESDLDSDTRGAAELAVADLADLFRATTCIAFTEPPAALQRGRGGRHVELGAALALGLRTIVVGPTEHVFHCLPTIERYDAWRDVRESLLKQRGDVSAVA